MPLVTRLMRPARSMSLWLTSSASEGASFNVERNNCETRMPVRCSQKALFYWTVYAIPTRQQNETTWQVAHPKAGGRRGDRVHQRAVRCALASHRQRHGTKRDAYSTAQRAG